MAEKSKYKMEKLTVPNWNLFNEKKTPKMMKTPPRKLLRAKSEQRLHH